MTGYLLLAASVVPLVAGAELFVENATGAARRLGVTVFGIGLLLAGAEPEELVTGIVASAAHRPGLAAGDAIGANLTIFTLVIGVAALVRPVPFGGRVRSYAVLSAVGGALATLALADGRVGRIEGALLLTAYAGLVAVIWRREKAPPVLGELAEVAEADERAERGSPVALLLVVLGVALMTLGGRLAVAGAVRVVDSLGVTDGAVGLTLLALATTAELLALVAAAARRRVTEIAVAGVVGSAAYNATATLGAAAVVRPLTIPGLRVPAVVAAVLPLAVVGLAPRGVLGRLAGIGLLTAYAGYVVAVLAG